MHLLTEMPMSVFMDAAILGAPAQLVNGPKPYLTYKCGNTFWSDLISNVPFDFTVICRRYYRWDSIMALACICFLMSSAKVIIIESFLRLILSIYIVYIWWIIFDLFLNRSSFLLNHFWIWSWHYVFWI